MKKNTLFFLITFGFLLRLCMAIPGMNSPEKTFFRPDSLSYINSAKAIWKTGHFYQSPESKTPATFRSPGYPVILAALFALSQSSLKIPVIFFCLLSALTAVFVHGTCKNLGAGNRACFAAILFFIGHLTSIAIAPLYLADTALTFWIAAQLFFFTRYLRSKNKFDLLGSFFFNALAVLTKPIAFGSLLGCLFWLAFISPDPLRQRLQSLAQCLCVSLILCVPWMFRNQVAGAGFRLETNAANFYLHYRANLQSVLTGIPVQTWRDQWMRETNNEFQKYPEQYATEDAKYRYQKEKLKALIAEHPFTFLRLQLQPCVLLPDAATFFELLGITKTGRGTLDILNHQGFIAAVHHYFDGKIYLLWMISPLLLLALFMTLGCFFQVGFWFFEKKTTELFLFVSFVLFYLLLPGPIIAPRYHLPALPLMTVMAGLCLERIGGAEKGRGRK